MFWGGFVRFELLDNHQEVSFSWVCSWKMDSLILMERANSTSPFPSLSSLHFCFIIFFSEVPILKLPLWRSWMSHKQRVEPCFSKYYLSTSGSVTWHWLKIIQDQKIQFIDVCAIIDSTEKLILIWRFSILSTLPSPCQGEVWKWSLLASGRRKILRVYWRWIGTNGWTVVEVNSSTAVVAWYISTPMLSVQCVSFKDAVSFHHLKIYLGSLLDNTPSTAVHR